MNGIIKKILTIAILLLIIGVAFGFAFLRLQASGEESNYFNAKLRSKLSRSDLARAVFGLHYDGDARSDYLGNQMSEILIEVIPMEGLSVKHEIFDGLASTIERTVGKKTSVAYSFRNLPFADVSKKEDLAKQLESLKINKKTKDRAMLYVLIANQDREKNLVGLTLQENAIILYEQNLMQYEQEEDGTVFNKYATSVLLHEFGHQLGLSHNYFEECLMNASVELSDRPVAAMIVDDFCEYEKRMINSMGY